MTKIILADDHHLVRKGIRSLLGSDKSLEVIAEAGDGMEAAELTEKHKPDVLLLDLSLPRLDGISVIRRISESTGTKTIVLSVHADSLNVRDSLAAGAMGYIVKDSSPDDLVMGIESVMRGDPFISPSLRRMTLDAVLKPKASEAEPCNILTPRERLVLENAARGMSNANIAEKLFISTRTVESHRSNLMKKLNLESQTELVRFAIRQGIIAA
jgi:two-component system response regulator NreC